MRRETPLVTVLIPTYNRAHLLPRAVRSTLNQTYRNFELIIVDDGSMDDTPNVVKTFEDERIMYIRHEENRGILAARNTGLDAAKGDYLTRVDDDDELVPEALETAVKELNRLVPKGVHYIIFDVLDVESNRVSGSGAKREMPMTFEDFLCERVTPDYWGVITRELIGSERFDERLFGGEKIMGMRLRRRTATYYKPIVLYRVYRRHGDGRMSSLRKRMENASRVAMTEKIYIEENGGDLIKLCPWVFAKCLVKLGFYQAIAGETEGARKSLRCSLGIRFSVAALLIWLFTYLPWKRKIIDLLFR